MINLLCSAPSAEHECPQTFVAFSPLRCTFCCNFCYCCSRIENYEIVQQCWAIFIYRYFVETLLRWPNFITKVWHVTGLQTQFWASFDFFISPLHHLHHLNHFHHLHHLHQLLHLHHLNHQLRPIFTIISRSKLEKVTLSPGTRIIGSIFINFVGVLFSAKSILSFYQFQFAPNFSKISWDF